ncbi:MAG: pyrroloquinoline quinone biosynthesis protein PqqE [bacterium ADurb.Bin212]|nr:MAG: pyrroloquinoline quinone biosynthesis protein PqqE [bacterium ADurb.Bin212]
MKKNVSAKAVQHGLERKNTGNLQSLWIEFPGWCNLACSYCYACGGEKLRVEDLMTRDDYVKILDEAKEMGVDSIGVPGAGEPFVPANRELTMWFLQQCAEHGMYVTLFTTGQFITEDLAHELYGLPVELMLKGNSLDPSTQDKFVSSPKAEKPKVIHGYGAARNRAIEILMAAGFNNEVSCRKMWERKSRMALVTSIMTGADGELSNYNEMAQLLRFCRNNNVIFDCDSLLKRGRGASCDLCEEDARIKAKLTELQNIDATEYDTHWELSQSYVGTVCDRYMHHMYINQYGEIRPCIGAMDVNLGNIKNSSLPEAWNSVEMRVIRARTYHGKCGDECANFAEGKCNSCLGRRAFDLTNDSLREKGCVDTIGCWNFRPRE